MEDLLIVFFLLFIVTLLYNLISYYFQFGIKKEKSIEDIKRQNKKIRKIIINFIICLILFSIMEYYIYILSKKEIQNSMNELAKPIIYLYPEKEMEVEVNLSNSEKLIHTYPKYEEKWQVIAKPNGDLKDIKTGRNLYSLYWEGKSDLKEKYKDGFIVKGEDTIEFLEEKLAILGLTEREAEEFIVYWLPKLESNKYNYIRFASKEEIENEMELNIQPKPDTVIRILMMYKKTEKPYEVEEQRLETPVRKGFVAVEWGGTELK